MKLATILRISLGVLLAQGALVQAAEVAGRVLVAVGETSALRNGQAVRLAAGSVVEAGDTLRVGDASNMQVRFTDASVMALRPNTVFRIDEYAFANKVDSDKSVFALLTGGLRTITGLIGRQSRGNYAVKTETSTIGIRGTHFTLVSCNDSCRNPDGGLAPNGTYGGVADGRIVNANKAGEREFGRNEYFYVASSTSLPQPLLAPPSFLRDRLEGQAKASGKSTTASAGTGTSGKESAGSEDSGKTRISTTPVAVAETPTQVVPQQISTAAAEQTAVKETVVTPKPTLEACIAAPATAGCAVVLPSLAVCTAAPTTLGCSVVLPTLAACIAAPSTAGCSTILPTLATCLATPATAGCSAVLPTLAACIAAPSTAGCSTILPTLATCLASPATAGCSAVLPAVAALPGDGNRVSATTGIVSAFAASQFGNSSPLHQVTVYATSVTANWDSLGLKRIECGSGCFVDRNTALVAEFGADAGVIAYGRWISGPLLAGGWWQGLNFTADNSGFGYVTGVAATNIPASGAYTYNFLAATRPVFSDGIGGGLGSGSVTTGSVTANFVARTVNASLSLLFAGGNSAYTLTMPSTSLSGSQFSGSGTMAFNSGAKNVCGSASCSAQFGGFLAGNGATHAGLAYDVSAADGTTPFYIDGVAAFKYVAPTSGPYNLASAGAWTTSTNTNVTSSDTSASPMTAAQLASAVVANPSLLKANFGNGDVAASSLTDTGSSPVAGNVFWGVTTGSGYPITGVHGAFGDAVTNKPSSGAYTYNWVGGTHPRDSLGGTGTWNSAVLSIDFTSKLASTVGSWSWSVSGRNYSLAFSNIPYDTGTNQGAVIVAGSGSGGYPTNPAGSSFSVSGTNGSVTGYGVWVNGSFTGDGAAGTIVAIASQDTESGTGNVTTASTQVFSKGSTATSSTPDSSSTSCTTYPCSGSSNEVHGYVSNTTSTSSTASGSVVSNFKSSYAWAQQSQWTYNSAPVPGTSTGPTLVASIYTPGPVLDQGSNAAAGNLEWKRFSYQSSTSYSDGSSYGNASYDHSIRGDRVTAMPTSGSFSFSHIGGTQPTDLNGNVGTLTSGGSWNVDFSTKTVSTVTPVTWNVNNVSYNLAVPAQTLTINTSTYNAPDGSYTSTSTLSMPITNINLTCSPNCSPNAGGSTVAAGFFGANAQGMGVGYATSANVGGSNQYTTHVQAYKR